MSKWIIKAYSKEKIETIKRLKELAKEKGVYSLNDIYFSPLKENQLGLYDTDNNVIVLDDDLIYAKEDEIKNIFLHELAHYIQYRYENTGDHGKTFHEICSGLGVATEYAKAKVKLSDKHNKAQKIQKLLALSSSPEAPEAQAALKKAQQLMAETSVDSLDEDIIYEATIYQGKTIPTIIRQITAAAKTISGGFAFIARTPTEATLSIYGTYEMVETFTYLYDYLEYQLERDYENYLSTTFLNGTITQKINYYIGACNSIIKRYSPSEANKDSRALVAINSQVKDKTAEILFPNTRFRTKKRTFTYDEDAYSSGKEAGKNMQIRHGLKQKSSSQLFLE